MSAPNENAVDKAARLGMKLVLPEPNELFVDLDNHEAIKDFKVRWEEFLKVYPLSSVTYTTSKGGNLHAYITMLEPVESMTHRIALQAALGSDPLREMIAVKHLLEGYEYPSCFFEKPDYVRRNEP